DRPGPARSLRSCSPPDAGSGQASALIVGRAGTLRGDHRRAEWCERSAEGAERGALGRLDAAPQHVAGATGGGLVDVNAPEPELPLRVVRRELFAQPQAALRDLSDSPPLAIGQLEHLLDQPPR